MANETLRIRDLTNAEFLARYARPGRIGLASGQTLIDKAICLAERHVSSTGHWGLWSHSFVFEGERLDGRMWVMESDLQIVTKHIQLGAQENRATKFHTDNEYSNLAILDFNLTPEQTQAVLRAGLELVAQHSRYSMRELFGAWFALRHQERRGHANVLSRDHSYFCSAFVLHLFREAGLDLLPGVDEKTCSPEDLFRTAVPHTAYLLVREKVKSVAVTAFRKVRVGIRQTLRGRSKSAPE